MTQGILVFESTHQVLKAEKVLQEKGIRHEIIPTPKDLSSNCGMSIRIFQPPSIIQTISRILAEHNISFILHERASHDTI